MEMERTYYLAPLAGYTDLPYRRACRSQGAHYMFTALIDAGALVHGNPENEHILERGEEEDWLGVQLLGSIPNDVAKSTEMLNDMNYDAFDFNMGCPMAKVLKRPAGAALLYPVNHALAFQCVSIIRERVKDKPFTVKIRILDENDPEPTVTFCKRLVDLGVEGITIHGRLASKIYSGPVATEVIRAVRESVSVPVTANGGIFSIDDANALADATGCNRLMFARGSLGNPWIFRELISGAPYRPAHLELCEVMQRHIVGMMEMYGERTGLLLARKIIVAYLRGRGYSKYFRIKAGLLSTRDEFDTFMQELRVKGPVGGL
jgi:tRNA-dihydrouridine synthase B